MYFRKKMKGIKNVRIMDVHILIHDDTRLSIFKSHIFLCMMVIFVQKKMMVMKEKIFS